MEKRAAKIMFSKAGGNASKNSYTTRISIPISWVKDLNLTLENREVELIYDKENQEIKIKKVN